MPIADYLPDWVPALDAEIATSRRRGGDRYHLQSGQALGMSAARYLYRFRPTRPCVAPDDAEVVIEAAGQHVDGRLISSDDDEIVVALVEPLERVGRATLIVQLWFILEQLRDRLQSPARAGSSLFDGARLGAGLRSDAQTHPHENKVYPGLNAEQSHAVRVGKQPGVWFLWGPPGTGKTRTLGELAAQLAADGKRVLFLTFSNDALDVAALRVLADAKDDLRRPGVVLRLGYPRRAAVRDHPTLTPTSALRRLKPHLVAAYDEAARELERARQSNAAARQIVDLRDRLRARRDELRKASDLLTLGAQVVLCTLARLATSDLLDGQKFDAVIVDEASMVPPPYAGLASTYATRTVVYAGDFRQLPPVVLTNEEPARTTLLASVFDHAGIAQRSFDGPTTDPRLVSLVEQYRMVDDIAERVSRVFYGGRLRTAPIVGSRPTDGALVVDIQAFAPFSQPEASDYGTSRFNVASAVLSLALARQAAHALAGDVGIITPFRAQATLLRALALDCGLHWLRISTVHRYQGDEADTIVLDLATARGHQRLGHLLGGTPTSQAGRLVNVAMSRARRNLFVVTDWRHLEDRWSATRSGHQHEALFQVLRDIPRVQLVPAHVGGVQNLIGDIRPFQAPAVPFADGTRHDVPNPSNSWPIILREGGVYQGLAAQQMMAPTQQLLVAVRESSRPADWLKRAHDRGIEVVVRGTNLHRDWQRQLPRARFIEGKSPIDTIVVDGERFAATFHIDPGGEVYTVEVASRRAAPLIAELAGLQSLGGRIMRLTPSNVAVDPPPVAAIPPPPAPESFPPEMLLPEVPLVDVPPRCPISDHRLILRVWPRPVSLGCSETRCDFNDEELRDDDPQTPGPFRTFAADPRSGAPSNQVLRARALEERRAYVLLVSRGLACDQHEVIPLGSYTPRGLVFICTHSGCTWRGISPSTAIFL